MQGEPGQSQPNASAAPSARCVLWRSAAASAPPDLLQSLRKRNLEIFDCTDPYTAMARLCLLQRQGAGGAGPARPFILIVVSPTTLPEASDLVRAAERYAPRAVCWMFEALAPGSSTGASNPRLRRIVPEDVQFWSQRRSADAGDAAARPRPPLRLAGDEALQVADEPARPRPAPTVSPSPARPRPFAPSLIQPTPAPSREPAIAPATSSAATPPDHRPRVHPVLTNEELSMLLADDDDPRRAAAASPLATPPMPRPRAPRSPSSPPGNGPRPPAGGGGGA